MKSNNILFLTLANLTLFDLILGKLSNFSEVTNEFNSI